MKRSIRFCRCQLRNAKAPQTATTAAIGPKNAARKDAAITQSPAAAPAV